MYVYILYLCMCISQPPVYHEGCEPPVLLGTCSSTAQVNMTAYIYMPSCLYIYIHIGRLYHIRRVSLLQLRTTSNLCVYIHMYVYIYIVVHVYHMCIVVHVYYMLYIHICIFLYYYYMIPAMLHPRHLLGIILATTSIHLHGWRGLTEHVHIFNVYIYICYTT